MTFGECLTDLMHKKGISVADLAKRLNYRSKTSLSRILRDETRYSSIEDFINRLEPVSAWFLNEEERAQLRHAMEVSRVGRERYEAYQDIWRLVRRRDQSWQEVRVERFGSIGETTLEELTERWAEADRLDIMIINSGHESLFRALNGMLRSHPQLNCSIRHYLTMRDAPGFLARQLGALIEVLHDPRYQGYYGADFGQAFQGGHGVNTQLMVAQTLKADGHRHTDILAMYNEHSCVLYGDSGAEGLMDFCLRVMEHSCPDAVPLKTEYAEQGMLEGLTAISRRYLQCEQDRGLCCYAPAVCMELIPPEIMRRVLLDSTLCGLDSADARVEELYRLHRARYENIDRKKKRSAFFFSWDGMQRFAETGCTSDRISGMRPFTPEERAAILNDLAGRCSRNVFLSAYILRPEMRVRELTLLCHEGLGVYLLDPQTQYDVDNGHSEAFMLAPGLADTVSAFSRDELIDKCTFTGAESIEIIRRLADQAVGM